MSLNFDLSKIAEDKRHLAYAGNVIPEKGSRNWEVSEEAKAAIFATAAIGIPLITEDNYQDFYRKYLAVWFALGYRAEQLPLTEEKVHDFVGLSTNASKMTKTQFEKTLAARIIQRVEDHLYIARNIRNKES